jgi:hypothetical protein
VKGGISSFSLDTLLNKTRNLGAYVTGVTQFHAEDAAINMMLDTMDSEWPAQEKSGWASTAWPFTAFSPYVSKPTGVLSTSGLTYTTRSRSAEPPRLPAARRFWIG